VLGKLNVAEKLINMPTEMSGLGLFNIEDFLPSLQVTWTLKAEKSCREIWRAQIIEKTFGNPLCNHPLLYNDNCNLALYNLAKSFHNFRKIFDSSNDNFHNS
jgi:hypothetical protein